MPRLSALLCLAVASSASRVQTDLEELSAEEALAARASAWTGQVLRGRYQLLELQEGGSLQKMNPVRKVKKWMKKHRRAEGKEEGAEAKDKAFREPKGHVSRRVGDFPWGAGSESPLRETLYQDPQELGRGSYGDAWRAYDAETKEEVVVKIFYRGSRYVTKQSMRMDPYAEEAVEEGEEECKLVHGMMEQESSYPEGRGHICNCLASHAKDQTREDDVSFLVLEQCGQSLKSKLMAQWQEPDPSFYADVRHWMKGVLGAVRFMSGLQTPMLHMDIHWDNIVITDQNEAKLIDFGFTQAFNEPFPEVEHHRSPPEHVWTQGGTMGQYPRDKAWAYDVWSTGGLYSEILCSQKSFPFSTADASELPGFQEGQSHFRCKAGEEGSGTEQDWAVVNAALTSYEQWQIETHLCKQWRELL